MLQESRLIVMNHGTHLVFCGTVWLGVWPLSAELTAAAHDVERGLLASLGLGTVAVS